MASAGKKDIRKSLARQFHKNRRLWIAIAVCLVCVILLGGPGLAWLRCSTTFRTSENPIDALYLVAGAKDQIRRTTAVTRYTQIPRYLVGTDRTIAQWSKKQQRNLTIAEWSIIRIRQAVQTESRPDIPIEIVPGNFMGTDGEMESLALFLRKKPEIKSILLITSAFHVRRTVRRLNFHIGSDSNISIFTDSPPATLHDRMPWVVGIEMLKIFRDALGLSKAKLLSR